MNLPSMEGMDDFFIWLHHWNNLLLAALVSTGMLGMVVVLINITGRRFFIDVVWLIYLVWTCFLWNIAAALTGWDV